MHLDRTLSQELSEELQNRSRQIRLGFSMGRTNEILEGILPRFYEKYPDIKLSLKADTSRRQILALQNRSLDLAMVTNVERMPGYTHIPIFRWSGPGCLWLWREILPFFRRDGRMQTTPIP